jgi:hypothetical protein|tara:strand:- start:32 stop:568 length:537 start_codon:yes stop_codon:yes gene_type:complete
MSDPYIYEQLNTFTLKNVSAENIANITDPTHIEFENQFDLERYNLINKALYRDGQPMPQSGKQAIYTQANDSDFQYIQPPKGEVWRIQAMSALNSVATTGNNSYFIYFTDTNGATTGNSVYYGAVVSGSTNVPYETLFEKHGSPIILDHNSFILIYSNMDNVGAGGTVSFKVQYVRLR